MEHEPEPLVRSHAAWALGALGGVAAKRELERAQKRESDSEVAAEIVSALSAL
jgi:epoxyqueuosine reductase